MPIGHVDESFRRIFLSRPTDGISIKVKKRLRDFVYCYVRMSSTYTSIREISKIIFISWTLFSPRKFHVRSTYLLNRENVLKPWRKIDVKMVPTDSRSSNIHWNEQARNRVLKTTPSEFAKLKERKNLTMIRKKSRTSY